MKVKKNIRSIPVLAIVVLVVSMVKSSKATEACEANSTMCDFSKEAVRSGYDRFLQKTQDSYYELFPYAIVYKPGVTSKEVKRVYKPFDPSPENLKKITDKAKDLLREIDAMKINKASLKLKEKKALYQIKHFLQFNFGIPYGVNYYAGDFLMGPNLLCWQPICYINSYAERAISFLIPKEVEDLDTLKEKLVLFNKTYEQYMTNLRYGIKAGMVRSVEECKAGLYVIKRTFAKVALNGPAGIFQENLVKSMLTAKFFSNIINKTEDIKRWQTKHKKSINETVRGWILEYLGKPIDKLFKYLENDYAKYCLPSTIAGGLGSLPVEYIYKNGMNTRTRTTKKLPTGEPLDGKKTYQMIMPYFTSNCMSPDDVHNLGLKMLNKLYPQVLELARQVTNQNNNDTAKNMLIKRLNKPDMYYNSEPIPPKESDKNAHKLCSTVEKAQIHCPKRWAAMQRWFYDAYKYMSLLSPKTVGMFHFTGDKRTTPNCPVELQPDFNPSNGFQSYWRSDTNCTKASIFKIPFFMDRPGPKYVELGLSVHEVRPGHHTQLQGLEERFRDTCGGVIQWLQRRVFYSAFVEGWALYTENPLMAKETDIYNERPLAKYGMLKWQVWRALRLIVDTGLHYKTFSRQKALKFFADYAWDISDIPQKEVTRYQSIPGQATAYMVGQLEIIKLRDYAKSKLKEKFNLKDFHFYLLSQGDVPLTYLKEIIEQYVDCTLDGGKGPGCYEVLNPVANNPKAGAAMAKGMVVDTVWMDEPVEEPSRHRYI